MLGGFHLKSNMSMPFSRTLRSLSADSFKSWSIVLLVATLTLSLWLAWSIFAQIPLYVMTANARVEVSRDVHPIETPITGRVVAIHVALGKEVVAGEVLFELDARDQQLDLNEELIRHSTIEPQISVAQRQIEDEEQGIENEKQALNVALAEARARHTEALESAVFAEEEAKRIAAVYRDGFIAEVEFLRYQAEAKKKRAAAESLRLAVDRIAWEQRTKENSRRAHIESLKREITALQGNVATSTATAKLWNTRWASTW